MTKRIGIIAGASGVSSSTLIQAVLKMESEFLRTYEWVKASYPLKDKKVPTFGQFRRDIKKMAEESEFSYSQICEQIRMGCLHYEPPKYEEAKEIKEARQKFVDFFETNKKG